MGSNQKIIDIFKELAKIYNDILDDEYRALAYSKAIYSIRKYNKPIKDALKLKLPGIGVSIASKINEIVNTGTLKLLDELKKHPHIKLLKDMLRVQGFSKKYVIELIKTHNVNTINDIKRLHKNKIIKLNKTQEKGLKYAIDSLQKVEREEIKKIYNIIKKEARKLCKNIHVELVGSYRRGKPYSKDIDIMIMKPGAKKIDNFMEKFIKHLKDIGIHGVSFMRGPRKFNGMIKTKNSKFARHLDLMYVLPNEYYTALQSFTRSRVHNVRLRGIAKEKGMKLSDRGLFKNGKKIKINSEKDLYKKLGLPYVNPSKRDI